MPRNCPALPQPPQTGHRLTLFVAPFLQVLGIGMAEGVKNVDRLPPRHLGMVSLAEGGVGGAEAIQHDGLPISGAQLAVDFYGALIAANGLHVVTEFLGP